MIYTTRRVIESPLGGDYRNNFRYLLWCCRALLLKEGLYPIASHMIGPWFLNDKDPVERHIGMSSPWVWDPEVPHVFFVDLGYSPGMRDALERCEREGIPHGTKHLRDIDPEGAAAYLRGEWPPHTPAFELGSRDTSF